MIRDLPNLAAVHVRSNRTVSRLDLDCRSPARRYHGFFRLKQQYCELGDRDEASQLQ